MKFLKKLFYRIVFNIKFLKKKQKKLINVDNYADLITINPATNSASADIPKIIWLYWEGNMPELVEKCMQHIKALHRDYEVHILNPGNVQNFCSFDLNQIIIKNATPQQRADLIRLNLIYEFGGIWLDASTLVYEKLDWINTLVKIHHCQCFSYYRAKNTTKINYPVVENWLIASVPKNLFYKYWFDGLIKAIEIGPKLYIKNLRKQTNHAEIFQEIGRPEYLIAYIVCQQVMREYKASMVLINCDKNAFLYQVKNEWIKEKIAITLAIDQAPNLGPYLIKLAGKERKILSHIFLKKRYLYDSLLANFKNSMVN